MANATIAFNVAKSNGALVTGTATTNATGSATYKLRFSRKDPVGVYQVGATVSDGGYTASAMTSFTVQ